MTVIDGVFCVRFARDEQTRESRRVSIVTLDRSEIMDGYNTTVTGMRI